MLDYAKIKILKVCQEKKFRINFLQFNQNYSYQELIMNRFKLI
jgi:hypothetical protein